MPDAGWLRPLLLLAWVVLFAFAMPAVFVVVQEWRRRKHVPMPRVP